MHGLMHAHRVSAWQTGTVRHAALLRAALILRAVLLLHTARWLLAAKACVAARLLLIDVLAMWPLAIDLIVRLSICISRQVDGASVAGADHARSVSPQL